MLFDLSVIDVWNRIMHSPYYTVRQKAMDDQLIA